MDRREEQQVTSLGLGLSVGLVALLPATASLDLKWVALALAATALLLFKSVTLLAAGAPSQLLRRRRPFEWLAAAWLAVLVLASLASDWPDAGWLAMEQAVPGLVIAVFARNLEPDARGRQLLVWIFLGTASLVSLYALLQSAGIEFVEAYARQERGRAMAGFGNPTFLAGWLVAIWPFTLLAWLRGWRLAAAAAALLMAAALLATQTRSGLVALAAQGGLVAFALLALGGKSRAARRKLLVLCGIALALAGAAALALPMETWTRPTQRLALWSASLDLWLQHPFLGLGPGSFVPAMQEHLPAELAEQLLASRQFAEHPHNFLLSWLFDGGLLFASAYAALVLYCLKGPWAVLVSGRRERRELHEAETWSLALALSLAGLLVQNLFDRNLGLAGSSILFWVLLGWMAPQESATTTRVVDTGTLRVGGAALLVLAALVGWTSVKTVNDYRRLAAQEQFVGERVDEATREEKDTARYLFEHPEDAGAWEAYGQSLARQEKFAQAAQAYQQSLRLRPGSLTSTMNLGNCYFKLNRWDDAAERFKQAISLRPGHADAHFNLGYVRYYQNRMKEALRSLNQALKLEPSHAGARRLKQAILQP